MRENRPYGSEGGSAFADPDPYSTGRADDEGSTTFADIGRAATNAGITVPPLMQVKEKFGLLRIYARKSGDGAEHDAFRDALEFVRQRYEAASAAICVCCGKPDSIVDRPGSMRVRCESCP